MQAHGRGEDMGKAVVNRYICVLRIIRYIRGALAFHVLGWRYHIPHTFPQAARGARAPDKADSPRPPIARTKSGYREIAVKFIDGSRSRTPVYVVSQFGADTVKHRGSKSLAVPKVSFARPCSSARVTYGSAEEASVVCAALSVDPEVRAASDRPVSRI